MELNNWPTRAADLEKWQHGNWSLRPDREQTQWMAQMIAELEAENALLKAPVSDAEWYEIWGAGMCLGMIGNEGATKDGFDTIIDARAALTDKEGGMG